MSSSGRVEHAASHHPRRLQRAPLARHVGAGSDAHSTHPQPIRRDAHRAAGGRHERTESRVLAFAQELLRIIHRQAARKGRQSHCSRGWKLRQVGLYLVPVRSCLLFFVCSQILSKKIGLVVESIQSHRAKLRFAYRAQSYRLLLQRMRDRKKKLGLTNRDSLNPQGALGFARQQQGTPSIGGQETNSANSSWDALHAQQQQSDPAQPTHGSLLKHRFAVPNMVNGNSAGGGATGGGIGGNHANQVDEDEEEADRAADDERSIHIESLAAIAAMRAANAANSE